MSTWSVLQDCSVVIVQSSFQMITTDPLLHQSKMSGQEESKDVTIIFNLKKINDDEHGEFHVSSMCLVLLRIKENRGVPSTT